MKRKAYSHCLLLLLPAIILFSCSGQGKAPENNLDTPHKALPASTPGTNSLLNDTAAASPRIIKSARARAYTGPNTDTAQVSQYIRCMLQDRSGNLWFGTVGDGVCRYDGKTLTYYTPAEGFGGVSVQGMAEDKNGNIWFGTEGGLSKYDGTRFIHFSEKDGLSSRHVFSLLIDRSENIWVGTAKGLCCCNVSALSNKGTETFSVFPIPESGTGLEIKSILEDRAGHIWFAANGAGAYCYDPSVPGRKLLAHVTEKDGLGNNKVHCILQDKNENIWFSTLGGGLCRYDPHALSVAGSGPFTCYTDEKGSNEVWKLFEAGTGTLWISTRGSVRCFDPLALLRPGGKLFTVFGAEYGLTNCCVQSIYEDRMGNLWFGSGAGLFRLNKHRLSHSCNQNKCGHNLQIEQQLKEHRSQLSKTFVNVTKKGPWPLQF